MCGETIEELRSIANKVFLFFPSTTSSPSIENKRMCIDFVEFIANGIVGIVIVLNVVLDWGIVQT